MHKHRIGARWEEMRKETEKSPATRIIGQPAELSVVGFLLPVLQGLPHPEGLLAQPVVLHYPGSDQNIIPLFTSPEQLHQTLDALKIGDVRILQIKDEQEFLTTMREMRKAGCRIVLDPRMLDGKMRWKEIYLPGEATPVAGDFQ